MFRLTFFGTLISSLILFSGCATHRDTLVNVRDSFYVGDLEQASKILSEKTESKGLKISASTESDVCLLDQAIVSLVSGNPKKAEQELRVVRDNFDRLEQKNGAEFALAMLTDDKAMAYSGEDYEKVMIRVFLTLTNLMGDGQDAKAYSFQIGQKQNQIIELGKDKKTGENPKASYKQVPISAYLCGILREQEMSGGSEAAYWFNMMNQWAKDFDPTGENLRRVQSGMSSQKGNGVVHIIALVGRGPYKQQVAEPVTQISLLIADQLVSAFSKYSVPPTIAPVPIPEIVCPPNPIQYVSVAVNGTPRAQTRTITDIGQMAKEQFDANKPAIIGRAVARRVIKKGAVYATKEGLGLDQSAEGQLASVALDVGGIVWEATESADTRCWGLLPDKIQVARIELPAGEHTISLTPEGSYRPLTAEAQRQISVRDGEDTFVLAYIPGSGWADSEPKPAYDPFFMTWYRRPKYIATSNVVGDIQVSR